MGTIVLTLVFYGMVIGISVALLAEAWAAGRGKGEM